MTTLPPADTPAPSGGDLPLARPDEPRARSRRTDPNLAAPLSRRAWRMQILTTIVFTTAVMTALMLWAQAL